MIELHELTLTNGRITGVTLARTISDVPANKDIKYLIYGKNYSFEKAEKLLKELAARRYLIDNIETIRKKYGKRGNEI